MRKLSKCETKKCDRFRSEYFRVVFFNYLRKRNIIYLYQIPIKDDKILNTFLGRNNYIENKAKKWAPLKKLLNII